MACSRTSQFAGRWHQSVHSTKGKPRELRPRPSNSPEVIDSEGLDQEVLGRGQSLNLRKKPSDKILGSSLFSVEELCSMYLPGLSQRD
jgi:hypothetical protein